MVNCLAEREAQESTFVRDYFHKISGVNQGNVQQLNKTTSYVLIVVELSPFVLLIQYLLISKSDSWPNFFLKCFKISLFL